MRVTGRFSFREIPEVAVQAIAEVHQVLHPHGLVQAILGVQGVHGGLRKLFIASEGVAGKQPLHKERQGDQHKQGDNRVPNAFEHIFEHAAISSFP